MITSEKYEKKEEEEKHAMVTKPVARSGSGIDRELRTRMKNKSTKLCTACAALLIAAVAGGIIASATGMLGIANAMMPECKRGSCTDGGSGGGGSSGCVYRGAAFRDGDTIDVLGSGVITTYRCDDGSWTPIKTTNL